jgi:hypothetical protein
VAVGVGVDVEVGVGVDVPVFVTVGVIEGVSVKWVGVKVGVGSPTVTRAELTPLQAPDADCPRTSSRYSPGVGGFHINLRVASDPAESVDGIIAASSPLIFSSPAATPPASAT